MNHRSIRGLLASTVMLIVFATAAVVISLFMHWDDVSRGFHDGYNPVRPTAPSSR